MKHREIIDRMRYVLGAESLAALARELEIAPSAINAAIRQKRLPDVWLYKVAYWTGRRVEWLRSGKGPEFAHDAPQELAQYRRDVPPALQGRNTAADTMATGAGAKETRSEAEERRTILRLREALRSGHEDIRRHLIRQLELVENTVSLRQQQGAKNKDSA